MLNHQAWDREKVMAVLCGLIATSDKSLATLTASGYQGLSLPAPKTIFEWLDEDERLSKQYARAKDAQATFLAESIIEIADEKVTTIRGDKHPEARTGEDGNVEVVFDSAAVARNRLRVDARKWLASKLAPKKFGDKVQVGGAEDLPPIQADVTLTPNEAYMRMLRGNGDS